MLLSEYRKFIFIHIYKNAGTSVVSALLPYALSPMAKLANRITRKLGFKQPFDAQPFPGHATASDVKAALGADRFDNYFSFAIVRNPWDWQVSLYNFMLKDRNHNQHELIVKLGSFDNYIRWRCCSEVRYQKDFVVSADGTMLVDYIGRYETLDKDFECICDRIGVKTTLPWIRKSNIAPYQEYYSAETIDLVRLAFRPDIEKFGYEY